MAEREAAESTGGRTIAAAGAFAERLDLLEESGQVSALARRLTEFVIAELATELDIEFSEDNAAQFVTHVAIALTRLNRGEQEVAASAVVDEEISGRDREISLMARLMDECEGFLNRSIPESERAYMTVHLCALVED